MNQKNKDLLFAGIFIVLAIGLIMAFGYNARNKKSLKAEKMTSVTLLTEKEKALAELDRLNKELAELGSVSEENMRMLTESRDNISGLEKKISSLSAENRSLRKSGAELADLKKKYEALENESARLRGEREELTARSEKLKKDLEDAENEKLQISADLNRARLYDADNFLVTATRGKKTEKVVICASRAKKLNIAFEIPAALSEALSFRITTPAGSVISPDDRQLTWFFAPETGRFVASLSSFTGEFEQSRQVVLNYVAKERLVKGEYKVEILSNGQNIGNCRILLK